MPDKKNKSEILRHSTAHVLAAAVLEMFPEAKFGMGPATEDGFFYDFELPRTLIPEDLPLLEEKMKKIIKADYKFERAEISIKEATEHFQKLGQTLKMEIIKDLEKEKGVAGCGLRVAIYKSGTFVDLCSGPHLESTGKINADAIKLTRISGAYWKGDEKNQQLQRIYGVVFTQEKELQEYLTQKEEAEKRDHRKLGKELDLFIFSDLVGPGLPIYTPKGATIRREIINYSNELQRGIGYQEVHTPNINKAELFKVSGHYEKFKDDMLKVISNYTAEEYFLKPMNCPQHTQIFASKMRSYKDLPIRIADFANLYRDEKPGELLGLTRLRCFCQDDGHSFCREDQIKTEFASILGIIKQAMKTYNMEYTIRLSLWDPETPEKYLGDPSVWENSQKLLEEILVENKIEYTRGVGEAAMYGPKMDLISKDSLGREWQISTIQLDLIMPTRFELSYIDEEGKKRTPIMIHRAITGSPERFMGILIEHYAGAFPVWLSPVQAMIIPVGEKFEKYAEKVNAVLQEKNIRSEINSNSESLGKRIREAEKQKIPYMLIVGEKEEASVEASMKVSIRHRDDKKQETMPLQDFVKKITKEIQEKK
ncbi:MAG: threonine--tRNA ligase [Candidatus Moranbacteria bacterium CG10_big_fil_rev_8_21_14_0_10_35_21]|nr:MAG: threonine--tRNA ligase [Candidatus Moranbacteria bacterium CG10_big_fil_rev_8_21_14_0_10_35_21]PJA88724.1 MAG: threonine--tRNA ligase [Candidatus Moranbacteria bacterium CG_4_9_14_3_um_filter_36_9]